MAEAKQATRRADWLALVQRDLKGADFEKRLVTRTVEGLRVEPLYDSETVDAVRLAQTASIGRVSEGGWTVGLRIDAGDVAVAARHLALAQHDGLGRITLSVAAQAGKAGVVLPTAEAHDTLLKTLPGTALEVAFDAGLAGPALLRAALEHARGRGVEGDWKLEAGVDLFGLAYSSGGLPCSFESALDMVCEEAKHYDDHTNVRLANLSSSAVSMAGGGLVHELAFVACGLLEHLRAAERNNLTLVKMSNRLTLTLAIGRDFFRELAKVRALRRIVARIFEASGIDPATVKIPVHAVTAERTWSSLDPWTNLLRGTVATVAAAAGGADSITVMPLDATIGPASDFGQRLARNTQLVLRHESHVGVVDDPGAGSWAIEAETEQLARAAWAMMQAIEAEGGLIAALRSGWLTAALEATAAERLRRVARRQEPITGVSEFAELDGRMPPPGESAPSADASAFDWLRSVSKLGGESSPEVLRVAKAHRDSEPFEALRARSEHGARPTAFLATSGPLATWKARGDWTTNALAAGGIGVVVSESSDEPTVVAAQFAASGAQIAVIVSADEQWAAILQPLAAALRAAGAKAVVLAGRYPDASALSALGVDISVFAGCDLVALLESLHDVIGGAQ